MMAKSVHIWFSKEHTGSSGKREVDGYRQASDSSKVEKISHNDTYEKDVPINKEKEGEQKSGK